MSQDAEVLGTDVLRQNEEYQRLESQHQQYEVRLTALADKAVLSEDEELEENTLKKKKLQLKDKMHALARQLRATN
jgi:uncharacterized protein YdcH (DUF465 family)